MTFKNLYDNTTIKLQSDVAYYKGFTLCRARGYASKCLSTNFQINNLKNVLNEKQN